MATKMEQLAIQCRQWRMHSMAPAVHLITFGAIGIDDHWRHLKGTNGDVTARGAIKRKECHRIATFTIGVNGANGTIFASITVWRLTGRDIAI